MLADFGPYFEFSQDAGEPAGAWLTLEESLAPTVLEQHVEAARVRLAARASVGRSAGEVRAVASTVAMGMFSRLISPTIAATLVGALTLRPDVRTTWLGVADHGGPPPLHTTAPLTQPDPEAAVTGLVVPLLKAFHEHFHISEQVLYGNAAASVAGACDVVQILRPELAAECAKLRARVLSTPPLEGTGTATGEFTRNSCCLIYQLHRDYICGNCVLLAHDTPTAQRRVEAMMPTRHRLAKQSRPDFSQPPFRRGRRESADDLDVEGGVSQHAPEAEPEG